MSGPFKDHHCGLYRPANNGEGDCGICGFVETDHLRHLRNGSEAELFLARPVVGQHVVYYGVLHVVIDAMEQGFRLAAVRSSEKKRT